jgi:hypothetical protein
VTAPNGFPPVGFCPHCGRPLDVTDFVQEYWAAQTRVFHVWCRACQFTADVVPTKRMFGHEPAHR